MGACRQTSKGGGGRPGGGGVNPNDIVSTRNMFDLTNPDVANKHDMINQTFETYNYFNDTYGLDLKEIQLAELKGKAKSKVLGYYDGANVAINNNYFNKTKITNAYKDSVKSGYHPSNGNKTALQAVEAHEIGHSLNGIAAKKMNMSFDKAAEKVVTEARKTTKHRGNIIFGGKISGYARTSNAETIAEAVADVYCNGSKARAESHAVVNTLTKYVK